MYNNLKLKDSILEVDELKTTIEESIKKCIYENAKEIVKYILNIISYIKIMFANFITFYKQNSKKKCYKLKTISKL